MKPSVLTQDGKSMLEGGGVVNVVSINMIDSTLNCINAYIIHDVHYIVYITVSNQ